MRASLGGKQVRDFSTADWHFLRSWRDSQGFGPSERCKRHSEAVLNWAVSNHIRTVILASHWIAYTESKHSRRLTDSQSPENYSMLDNAAVFSRGLDNLLAAPLEAIWDEKAITDSPLESSRSRNAL